MTVIAFEVVIGSSKQANRERDKTESERERGVETDVWWGEVSFIERSRRRLIFSRREVFVMRRGPWRNETDKFRERVL